jgi:hypothetical protein
MTAKSPVRDRPPAAVFRASAALLAWLCVAGVAAPAAAWEVRADAPADDFAAFHRRFSFVAYDYPRHAAHPLGTIGWEIFADAGADPGLDGEPFWKTVVAGDAPAGWVGVGRVGVRKGLPFGFDLGASYGRALGGDLDVVSVDLQKALLKGGALSPAFSVRATGSRSLGGGPYSFEQIGVEALASKGFTVLTPYLGAGVLYSDGSLDRAGGGRTSTDFTRGFVYAGLTLNLLLPKITVEVERGDVQQAAVRVAFGF